MEWGCGWYGMVWYYVCVFALETVVRGEKRGIGVYNESTLMLYVGYRLWMG